MSYVDNLHQLVALELGWSVEEVRSFSLPSLAALVRPTKPNLADKIRRFAESDDSIATPVKPTRNKR